MRTPGAPAAEPQTLLSQLSGAGRLARLPLNLVGGDVGAGGRALTGALTLADVLSGGARTGTPTSAARTALSGAGAGLDVLSGLNRFAPSVLPEAARGVIGSPAFGMAGPLLGLGAAGLNFAEGRIPEGIMGMISSGAAPAASLLGAPASAVSSLGLLGIPWAAGGLYQTLFGKGGLFAGSTKESAQSRWGKEQTRNQLGFIRNVQGTGTPEQVAGTLQAHLREPVSAAQLLDPTQLAALLNRRTGMWEDPSLPNPSASNLAGATLLTELARVGPQPENLDIMAGLRGGSVGAESAAQQLGYADIAQQIARGLMGQEVGSRAIRERWEGGAGLTPVLQRWAESGQAKTAARAPAWNLQNQEWGPSGNEAFQIEQLLSLPAATAAENAADLARRLTEQRTGTLTNPITVAGIPPEQLPPGLWQLPYGGHDITLNTLLGGSPLSVPDQIAEQENQYWNSLAMGGWGL